MYYNKEMKVTKTTKNDYLFYQDGVNYILNIGTIKKGDDTTTELLFEDVVNPQKVSVRVACGCTTVNKTILSQSSFSLAVKYTRCETSIDKTIVINEGKSDSIKIKIKGKCQ